MTRTNVDKTLQWLLLSFHDLEIAKSNIVLLRLDETSLLWYCRKTKNLKLA